MYTHDKRTKQRYDGKKKNVQIYGLISYTHTHDTRTRNRIIIYCIYVIIGCKNLFSCFSFGHAVAQLHGYTVFKNKTIVLHRCIMHGWRR